MDFNYQWKNLPSPDLEYTEKRIAELVDHTGLTDVFFQGKYCLDAGCGTGTGRLMGPYAGRETLLRMLDVIKHRGRDEYRNIRGWSCRLRKVIAKLTGKSSPVVSD